MMSTEMTENITEMAEMNTENTDITTEMAENVPKVTENNQVAETDEEKTAKIARVKALYDSVGVADAARKEIARLSERAIREAESTALPEKGHAALENFAHVLVGRNF